MVTDVFLYRLYIVFLNTITNESVEEVCYIGNTFDGAYQHKVKELTGHRMVSVSMHETYYSCITECIFYVRMQFLQRKWFIYTLLAVTTT